MCKRCVAWYETQEHGVIAGPQENSDVSPDEMHLLCEDSWPASSSTADDLTESVGTIRLDDDGTASLAGGPSETGSGITGTEATASSRQLPPHLRHTVKQAVPAASLPPHLRHTASSVSTATTMRENQRVSERVPYNAWDPAGARHEATKTPTVQSGAASSSVASVDTPSRSGKWSKPARVSRRTPSCCDAPLTCRPRRLLRSAKPTPWPWLRRRDVPRRPGLRPAPARTRRKMTSGETLAHGRLRGHVFRRGGRMRRDG